MTAPSDFLSAHPIDAVVVTVLPHVELTAAARVFEFAIEKPIYVDDAGTRYWLITLPATHHPAGLSVLLTCIGDPGIADAGAFCGDLFARCRPSLVILSGIAAGIKERVKLGDVVISDLVMGYEPARLTPAGAAPRFAWLSPPFRVSNVVSYLDIDGRARWMELFAQAQRSLKPADLPKVSLKADPASHFGTIASGDKLFVDDSLSSLRQRYHEPIRAGEMEAAGFAKAAQRKDFSWLVIRGISDYGDPRSKEQRARDRYHATAANSALAYIRAILEVSPPVLLGQLPSQMAGRPRKEELVLGEEILRVARDHTLSDRRRRRRMYELVDSWEAHFRPEPSALLLAERYRFEVDFGEPSSDLNVVDLRLLSLSRRPVEIFEDLLTGSTPVGTADLKLQLASSSRDVTVAIDEETSSDRMKHVKCHFPPLRRGTELSYRMTYSWYGHQAKNPMHWQEFLADFLVRRFELCIYSTGRVRLLGIVEESPRGEQRALSAEDVEVIANEESWLLTLLNPGYFCKYRIAFELLND